MQWMKLPSKTYFERDSIEYLQKNVVTLNVS